MKTHKNAVWALVVGGLMSSGTIIWADDPDSTRSSMPSAQNQATPDKGQASPSDKVANPQANTLGASQSLSAQNQAEKQILAQLHKTNQTEIQLGQLAQEKGESQGVR